MGPDGAGADGAGAAKAGRKCARQGSVLVFPDGDHGQPCCRWSSLHGARLGGDGGVGHPLAQLGGWWCFHRHGCAAVCRAKPRRRPPLPARVEHAIRPDDIHCSATRLVCLENTHNLAGGRVLSRSQTQDVRDLCDAHGLLLHIDGARLANAAVALDTTMAELAAPAHSATLCLSKGLGAPCGSLLAGSTDFIARALRLRKMLGGAMRQTGVVAAAGVYALEHNVRRMKQDHRLCARLREGFLSIPGMPKPAEADTNILLFDLPPSHDPERYTQHLEEHHGILISSARYGRQLRAVTHLHLEEADIDAVLDATEAFLAK
eukprot:m.426828 g.426828  ORF g.426828 m.426828 type:complete len:319 (-) comp20222_c14_seq4:1564-2520(-)